MNKAKKWLAHVLALAMVISSISVLSFGQQTKSEAASGSFQNLNQSQFVSAMGAGWNLGNQLEAANNGVPSETAWGNPTITENLIKAVKNAGFTSVRIPVSYMGHIGSDSNYTVDASWLNRNPYAELKSPPLLNQGESLPPLNVGPLSEVNTIKVFSYRCSAFSFSISWPICSSK